MTTRTCSKARLTAIALVIVAVLCICGGCDDPADIIGQAMGYTSSVSLNMAARGWEGFPSTPLALVDYMRDLKASIGEARSGRVALSSLGADVARPLAKDPWEPEPLGKAFGVVGE